MQENDYGNLKYTLYKVLNALKYFYSFKKLEDRLGVSAQILWRYVTLRSVPERETAEKLLAKIASENLVSEALAKIVNGGELWQMLSSPGVASLLELRVLESFKGEKINAIVAGPDGYSAAFGATLSDLFHARLCVASKTPYSKHVIAKNYKVSQDYYDTMLLPKECLPRRGRVLLVMVDLSKLPQVGALVDVAKLRQCTIVGVVGVVGAADKVREILKERLGIDARVVTLVDQSESSKGQQYQGRQGNQMLMAGSLHDSL